MRLLTTVLLVIVHLSGHGQVAMTFEEAELKNISMTHLDSIYKSGIHSDPSLAVFDSNQDEYIEAYKKLLHDLGQYLEVNDFIWENPTKGFNRIYFAKSGSIDYFLFMFRPNQLTKDQETRFEELLRLFIVDYKFSLSAEVSFAQCSPVTYMPQKK